MKYNKYLFLGLICLVIFYSCSKNSPPISTPTAAVDVYVSGNITYANGQIGAAYWKNGAIVKIADSSALSWASGIAVNNGDVYLIGEDAALTRAVYWKNGGPSTVLELKGLQYPTVQSIAFQGNDMFIAGFADNSNLINEAIYWKNGVATLLTNGKTANALAVNGSDVYITGLNSSTGDVVYWKNGGSPILYNATTAITQLEAIAISGTDIYLGGDTGNQGAFWKNGQATSVTSNGHVLGIAVYGSDVYTTGSINRIVNNAIDGGYAMYWKNNAPHQLSVYTSKAVAISLNGPDVYTAGLVYNNNAQQSLDGIYWKNNVPTTLDKGGDKIAEITGIVVVPR